MRFVAFMVLNLVLFLPTLSAQSEEQPKPAVEDNDSSRAKRVGKQYHVLAELLGLATPLTGGSGIIGGKYLDSNSIIELSLAVSNPGRKNQSNIDGDDGRSTFYQYYYTGHSHVLAARYKSFVGNSFYWYGGLAERTTKASFHIEDKLTLVTTEISNVDAQDIGANFGIGNAWQWDNFQIGCDWIGIYVPLVRIRHKVKDFNPSPTNDIEDEEDRFATYTKGGNIQALRFYLGAAF
jgi:hypothetical protein